MCVGEPSSDSMYKGVGSKIGVVRPGAGEVNVAVLCINRPFSDCRQIYVFIRIEVSQFSVYVVKLERADGYLSVTHFTACTTVHNGGGRHLRLGGGATVCMRA